MSLLKTSKKLILIVSILVISNVAQSQMVKIKKFDYSELENKTLYIPTYKASEKFIAKMERKGNFDKISDAKGKAELYNTNWKEAMAESTYDVSDYEIRGFDKRALEKSKNTKAILLYFSIDDYGNKTVSMLVTGPKRRVIASALINGFDLSEKSDIRLMMNILNDVLTVATEVEDEADKKNMKAMRNKYKERLVNFYDDMENKTFLVAKSSHKKAEKASKRDADVKVALKNWKLSKYEMVSEDEINKRRLNGDTESYYWRDVPLYTNTITYHYNYILTTENDNVIVVFFGKGRLKPAAVDKTQAKITSKALRYKNQLEK